MIEKTKVDICIQKSVMFQKKKYKCITQLSEQDLKLHETKKGNDRSREAREAAF